MIRAKNPALAPYADAIIAAAADIGATVLLFEPPEHKGRLCIAVAVDGHADMLRLGVRVGEISLQRPGVMAAHDLAGRSLIRPDANKLCGYWPEMEGVAIT